MPTRHGTSHYATEHSARRAYGAEYADAIREGRISVGKPALAAGEKLLIDTDGRYHIEEAAPIAEWTTYRTVCGKGRATYHAEWSASLPWVTYINGTAGRHGATIEACRAYFISCGMRLKGNPE